MGSSAKPNIALIGFMGTAYFGGFLVGCVTITRMMKAVGHVRSFATLAAVASAGTDPPRVTTSTPPLVPNPYMKPCKQCGKPYPERTTWQLFCCKKCRMLFHETNHGRPYLPHRVYRAKLKEMNGTKMSLFED